MAHGSLGSIGLALQIPIIQFPHVYHDVAYGNQVLSDDDDGDDDADDGDDDADDGHDDVLDMGPYGLGPKRCAVCAKQAPSPLIVCRGCIVVFYCGAAHQAIDRPYHKAACNTINRSHAQLWSEKQALRTHPGDISLPVNVFNTGVGDFGQYFETRKYLRMRFAAAEALLKIYTVTAVEKALTHFTDMLRLDKSDSLGVGDIIPSLLLRLGREQECYDFLMQSALEAHNGTYTHKSINAFERIKAFCEVDLSLSHLATLTLLKLRIYLDLEEFGQFEYRRYDDDIYDRPLGSLVRGRLRSLRKPWAKIKTVRGHYYKLCQRVNDANPHFWEALVDHETPSLPDHYEPGTVEEAHRVVHLCRAAWEESEGAIARVDLDTAQFTPVYGGHLAGTGTGDPHWQGHEALKKAANLSERRATGAAFPSKFQPPLPTSHPVNLFPPTPMTLRQGSQTLRFVSRTDREAALVYTDGACVNNGQTNPRGGWAVVLGPADGGKDCIVSGRLEETGPFGDQGRVATNNRAELRAAIAALRLWDWEKEGLYNIVVATDSSYVVDGATGWVRRWVGNGWKGNGGRVKNRDLWELLLEEVARWGARGGHVEFWKIPRSLNGEADRAAKAAADKPAVVEFTDVVMSETQPSILMLCLEPPFGAVHGRIAPRIASKAKIEVATTVEAALAILGKQPTPLIILVEDEGITKHRKVCEAVIRCLRKGATVVLAGCFSNMVSSGQLSRFFARLGLPWQQGSYERTTVNLARNVVHGRLATRLPSTYSQKALFLRNVAPSAAWYTSSGCRGQAAMAFARVGMGRLGYVGDVNSEEATDTVVLAMCGLLG